MDTNNDGTLSREELMNLYSKKNDKEKAKQIVDDIFDSVDLDHSGKVEFTGIFLCLNKRISDGCYIEGETEFIIKINVSF